MTAIVRPRIPAERTGAHSGLAFTALRAMRSACGVAAIALVTLAGCGPTSVVPVGPASGPLPRPQRVLVYDFAVSPEEVRLDTGISAQIQQEIEQYRGTSRSAEEVKIGHAVADAVAKELVSDIRTMGLPAERALGWPGGPGNVLMIKGQFLSIDEGNRTERVLIGFGTGRTSVQANVQVYELTAQGMRRVESLQADAKSGFKPGMAVMLGVGGLAGNLIASAAVGGAMSAGSELSWSTVDANGKRLARQVAKQLGQVFVRQDWIASAD